VLFRSLFSYAGFFIGFANHRNVYMVKLALLVMLLVTLEWLFELHWQEFLTVGIPIVIGVSFLGWMEQQTLLQRLQKQKSADEIKQLATMVERERIARDLHDILGHTLSSIVVKADLADKLLARERHADAQQQLAELGQIAREALSQVRQSVSGYKHKGLVGEVSSLMTRLRDAGFVVQLEGTIPQLESRTETALILALTELVTNVQRHSKGDSCQLSFTQDEHLLKVTLCDNGTITTITEGNGITGLRERLLALGGHLQLSTTKGFCATINLPIKDRIL